MECGVDVVLHHGQQEIAVCATRSLSTSGIVYWEFQPFRVAAQLNIRLRGGGQTAKQYIERTSTATKCSAVIEENLETVLANSREEQFGRIADSRYSVTQSDPCAALRAYGSTLRSRNRCRSLSSLRVTDRFSSSSIRKLKSRLTLQVTTAALRRRSRR